MTKKYFLYTISLSILLLFACNRSANKKRTHAANKIQKEQSFLPEIRKPSKKYIRKKKKVIDKFYNQYLDPKRFSGQFLVAKNGHVLYYRSNGYANYKTKEKITASTPLHVASVSKVATSLAVLRLVSQKKILLDADVRRYLPDLPYKDVTVRMLLNHRSGIPYYGYFTFETWPLGKTMHNKDMLLLMKKHKFPLNFPPDTKFAYCNTNYALLALIIEKVTGEKFPEAMKELIFEPLKMRNTFVLGYNADRTKISQSYNSKHVNQEFDYLDAIYGDKNMYTTAYDILQLDRGTYSELFLPDSLRQQLYKGYSYEYDGTNNYGLGIRLKESPGKSTFYFHSGWWHGNTACYATLRDDNVCIIALSNVYTQNVWRISRLSLEFGDYPFVFNEN